MDEQLKNAAIHTDGSAAYLFLNEAANNNPTEYFKSVYVPTSSDEQGGNIFHLSAYHNNGDFFEAALKELPEEVVHSLLCQEDGNPEKRQNPIHVAALLGHHWIVKLLLDYSSKGRRSITLEPWLARDGFAGRTPLHYVLEVGSQNQALKILSFIGVELVSSVEDKHGNSPLFLAVKRGYNQVAEKILGSPASFSLGGSHGSTALFFAPNCSDYICSRLLREHSELIIGKDESTGNTVLHQWAKIGKMYPFRQVLKGDFIPPHLRTEFMDQLSVTNNEGDNPLHVVAKSKYDRATTVEVAQILVETYNKLGRPDISNKATLPWFSRSDGGSPLHLVINHQNEQLALYFLSLDSIYFVSENCEDDLLFLAVEKGCSQVAQKILNMVDQHSLTRLLTVDNGQTVLHVAPRSTDAILRQVLENYPLLINESDEKGETILHSWIKIGEVWPFKYILKRDDINSEWRTSFVRLLGKYNAEKRNPLHVVVSSNNNNRVIEQIVELLLDAFQKEYPAGLSPCSHLPWLDKDRKGYTPLTEAMLNRREKVVLYFLSWNQDTTFLQLKDGGEGDILFKAVKYDCQQVVKIILDWVQKYDDFKDFLGSAKQNIVHVAFRCTEENCRLMVERWPELIYKYDHEWKTPLERAAEAGATWLVELILQKAPFSYLETPFAWIEACEKGHLSTVLSFVEKIPNFEKLCREYKDTPLHHLHGGLSHTEYRNFLEHPCLKELRNFRNIEGKTPLHAAIKSENKTLTEILLTMNDVEWNVKDHDGITAMHLLANRCSEDEGWELLCRRNGIDPSSKITYAVQQLAIDMKEMRNTISFVAALLATLTFTAGFTLPGGYNSENGEAILGRKAAFVAFLITNTYAMCCSMLILFIIIWSVNFLEHHKLSIRIHSHCLVLLKQSLYGTLLAFMTGVYATIHHKSLWVAIVILIMCSLSLISSSRKITRKVLFKSIKLIWRYKNRVRHKLYELMLTWEYHFQKQEPRNNQNEVQEAVAVDIQRETEEAAPTDNQSQLEPHSTVV